MIREKINEFFKENPTEELSLNDIADKWGFNRRSVENVVLGMRRLGEVELIKVVRIKDCLHFERNYAPKKTTP